MASAIAHYGLVSLPVSVFALVTVLLVVVAWLTSRRTASTLTEEQPELLRRIMPLLPYGSVLAAAVLPWPRVPAS